MSPAVYVQTNNATGNEVIAFSRVEDGALAPLGRYSTGGRGTGLPHLASAGSVALTNDASTPLFEHRLVCETRQSPVHDGTAAVRYQRVHPTVPLQTGRHEQAGDNCGQRNNDARHHTCRRDRD
jgi:hypothetical protein